MRAELRSAADLGSRRALLARLDVDALPVSTQSLLGSQLAARGALDDALRVFQRAAALHPDDFALQMNLGRALRLADPPRLQEATRAFSAALALRKDSVRAADELVSALHDLREYETAIRVIETALALHPGDAGLQGKLAREQSAAGRVAEALAAAERTLALDPRDVNALLARSGALLDRGEVEEAVELARRAVQAAPQNSRTRYALARALSAQGSPAEAEREYRLAIELEPGFAGAHNNLGGLLSARGAYAEALAERRTAVELDPASVPAIASLAWMLSMCPDASLRDAREALVWARRGIELAGDDANAYNNLGAALCSAGRWDAAVEALARSIELAGDADGGYLAAVDHALFALAHAGAGRSDEARAELALAEAWGTAHPRARGRELRQVLDEARRALGADASSGR